MEIKKTMVEALAFVTDHGNMSKENLDLFTNKFCVKASRSTGTGAPRESVKLFDVDGNVIARRCSVSHKWLLPESFNGDISKMSISREANKIKVANIRKGEATEKLSREVMLEARGLTDVEEKLAKFEEADALIEQARNEKTAPIEVVYADDVTVCDTIEEIAEVLGVEVITSAPKAETETEGVEETEEVA